MDVLISVGRGGSVSEFVQGSEKPWQKAYVPLCKRRNGDKSISIGMIVLKCSHF